MSSTSTSAASFIPISSSPSSGSHLLPPRKHSISGVSPASSGSSNGRRRGNSSSSNSFGGRARDVQKEVRQVLNQLRWHLCEVAGVPFGSTQVFISTLGSSSSCSSSGGGGGGGGGGRGLVPGGEEEEEASRWCRQWVREGRCDRKHCRYRHVLTLAPVGAKPSLKSAGSMAPLQVVEGEDLEAALAAAAISGSAGGGSGSGSSSTSSGNGVAPSSPFGGGPPPMYRAVFVVLGREQVVWDKERPEVWEAYLASHTNGGNSSSSSSNNSGAFPPRPPGMLRRGSSADSFSSLLETDAKSDASSVLPFVHPSLPHLVATEGGNSFLHAWPSDVSWELLAHFLLPEECARCIATCRGWAERAGEERLWRHVLARTFGWSLPPFQTKEAVRPVRAAAAAAAGAAASCSSSVSPEIVATVTAPRGQRRLVSKSSSSICCDLSTLALQDDDDLSAASLLDTASAAATATATGEEEDSFLRLRHTHATPLTHSPPPASVGEAEEEGKSSSSSSSNGEEVYFTSFHHPRRVYGRLRHACRNVQALKEWSDTGGYGGGGGGRGGGGGGGGGGGVFLSSSNSGGGGGSLPSSSSSPYLSSSPSPLFSTSPHPHNPDTPSLPFGPPPPSSSSSSSSSSSPSPSLHSAFPPPPVSHTSSRASTATTAGRSLPCMWTKTRTV